MISPVFFVTRNTPSWDAVLENALVTLPIQTW
jgi:hypothetical protein